MTKPNINSRFAALLEDTDSNTSFKKYNKKGNSDKSKKAYNNGKSEFKNERENNKIHNTKIKEEKNLDVENFPDLLNKTYIKPIELTSNSYIEKVKLIKPIETVKESHIKPGWVEIKRDNKTQKVVTTYNDITNNTNNDNNENIGINILTALVYLHNKRKMEYIELWGYDQWEKMFISPNYDYEYFDKLDEEYNEEQNEIYGYINE